VKNYNSLFGVVLGLSTTPISRLTATWKGLSKKETRLFRELSTICSITNNFWNLRSLLKKESPPYLPYFALFVKDITFIEEGNPTFLEEQDEKEEERGDEERKINWGKLEMLARVFKEIRNVQEWSFEELKPQYNLQLWLRSLHALSDDQLLLHSQLCEPPC